MKRFSDFVTEDDDGPIRIKLSGFGRSGVSDKVKNFMDDFHSGTSEHPFDPKERIYGSDASLHVSPDGREVHIHAITSLKPKSGAGTRTLKFLTDLADKHDVKLNLNATPYGSNKDFIGNQDDLVNWYKKRGFEEIADEDGYSDGEMKYYPK